MQHPLVPLLSLVLHDPVTVCTKRFIPDVCSDKARQATMSEPRHNKTSKVLITELRQEGLLPVKCPGAFPVPSKKPTRLPKLNARPARLKLEDSMMMPEWRFRRPVPPARSATHLRRELSNADIWSRVILAEGSSKLAKKEARITAETPSGTPFTITCVNDMDVFATRDAKKRRAVATYLVKRRAKRERIGKTVSMTSQEIAAQYRRRKANIAVSKAKRLGRTCLPVWDDNRRKSIKGRG
ncbi:uncharacterized protein [Branchiostoma lanceolatum]|uniref:uncharacterized protein n=1 Tax=Branchiostoma lanceolatum TaxID=7740 RepID=UPI003454F558